MPGFAFKVGVEDDEGLGGWIHYSLLSGVRTVIVQADMTELHAQPDPASRVVAQAETGVIGRLGACGEDWESGMNGKIQQAGMECER